LELLQSDVRVVAVARRRERLEALQTEVAGLGIDPGNLLPVVLDVTKEAEVLALPKIIGRRWPGAGIDILVNNAAVRRGDAALVSVGTSTSTSTFISTSTCTTIYPPSSSTLPALLLYPYFISFVFSLLSP
jgi:NADP-dependent 3-hydroxy acid dehydrogenase YdfG